MRSFLSCASVVFMLCNSGAFASAYPSVTPSKIGFSPRGGLYNLVETGDASSQLCFLDQEGRVRDTWDIPPCLNLKKILLTPDEEAFVVVEASGVVRLLLRSKVRTPHYLGKVLYTPQSLDQDVHVLGFSSPRKILIGATRPGFTKDDVADLEAQSRDLITQKIACDERWAALITAGKPSDEERVLQERNLHDFTQKMASLRQDITRIKILEGNSQTHIRELYMFSGVPVRVFDVPLKITHAAFCEKGSVLLSDRHPVQKHITNMWHLNLETSKMTPVRTNVQPIHSFSEKVAHKLSAQGESGYFLSYAGKTNTHNRLLRYDTASGVFAVAYAGDEESVSFGLAGASSKGYALLGGQDGNAQRLVILKNNEGVFEEDEAASAKVRKAVCGRRIERVKISSMGDRVLVTSLDTRTPGWATHTDLISLETGAHAPLSYEAHDMPEVRVETLPSTTGGVTSYTHLYTPARKTGDKMPLLVKLHGGPHTQSKVHYAPNLALLLRLGYTVADVNYRGSTGRGKVFHNLIEGDQGGGEVEDVVCAVENILQRDSYLDADNVFVMGLSYGAYLATMLGLKHPSMPKGLILIGGLYDWTGWAGKEGGSQRYVDASKISLFELDLRLRPFKFANMLKASTLVIHGVQDDICDVKGAQDLVRVMEDARRRVTFVPDETDHFYKNEGIKHRTIKRLIAFMENLRHGADDEKSPPVAVPTTCVDFLSDPPFDL